MTGVQTCALRSVEPGAEDRVDALLSGGACVYAPPEDVIVVRRLTDELAITETSVADKRSRALLQVLAVEQFARTANKAQYIERYFLGDA